MESSTRPTILDGLSEEERCALLHDAGLDRLQAVFAMVPESTCSVGDIRHRLSFPPVPAGHDVQAQSIDSRTRF